MYNKLFTKILDSSVWLESVNTRIVWLTFIASMDEDGFAAFAAVGNLANRARVSVAAAEAAIKTLEAPDPQSGDPDFEGRRIERTPGGWIVLNAPKYRELVTRVINRERTKERVRKHRALKQGVTKRNESVTPSEAYTYTEARSETEKIKGARVLAQNPHAKPTNLIDGSELRRHGTHAWCAIDRGLCVLPSLHAEFMAKGAKSDAEMRAWYEATIAKFEGVPIGEDAFRFWRNEFAGWIGTVTTAPGEKVSKRQPAARLKHDWRAECEVEHRGRCTNATFHAAQMEAK